MHANPRKLARAIACAFGAQLAVAAPAAFAQQAEKVEKIEVTGSNIERIEILKDGASAIYGSDAIAGVVNFILRRDYQGAELDVKYQQPQHHGAKTTRVDATAGWGDLARDRYNAVVVASYQKDEALFG